MNVLNESGLSIGWCVSRVPPHKLTATCIVKGTYALKPGETARLLEDQPPLNADVHEGDEIEKMLLVPGDFAHFKPACDVLLSGTCYARGGKPAPLERVTFGLGRWEKSLMVVGDRNWQPGLLGAKMTDPAPFVSMPLSYSRAYGGAGFSANPFGRGYVPIDKDLVAGKHPLPNIENPNAQITAPSSRPAPAGFGPVPAIWLARAGKGGTYDKKWLKQNWPFFPDNFDWSFFNYAPPDQQLKDFPKGDETLRMRQMHPTVASYEAKLPGVRPRFFLREQIGNKLEFREALLQLDTVFVDMDKELLTLVWRGVAPIASRRMIEVQDILVVAEPLAKAPAPAAGFERRLDRTEPAIAPEKPGPRPREAADTARPQRVAKVMAAAQQAARSKNLAPKTVQALEFLVAALEPHTKAAMPASAWTRERVQAAKPGELAGADLARLDLSGLKLAGVNLARSVLTFANLAKADLSGANLGAAILADANLSGANLAGAKLAGADLVHANLSGANLAKADIKGADLSLAEAKQASFENAQAQGALFVSGGFESANFSGAALANADFSEASLPRANFTGANAEAASFELADASDTNFAGASCAKLKAGRGANFSRAKFIGAKAAGASFYASRLDGADFKDADLSRAFFDGASLVGVNLGGVTAPGARFDHVTLKGAVAARGQFLKASFENANLTDADFRGANLFEAEFLDATGGTGKHFEGANIKRTKLA